MHKSRIALIAILLGAPISSQADQLQCTNVGWYDLGYQTAVAGTNVHFFDKYKDSCKERLDADAQDKYLDGYTEGVVEYCTYENGYKLGLNSKKAGATCPMEIRANFNRGYKTGVADFRNRKHQLKIMEENQEHKRLQTLSEDSQARPTGRH